MPKSVRSEMIWYFESFPRNWSNKEFKITIICALITSLCMLTFCRIHPPLFLSEYLDKNRTGSRSSLITTSKVSVSSRKKLPCVLAARGVGDRVAGGWKTGECTEAGSLEAIDTHISHLVPNNVHGVCPLLISSPPNPPVSNDQTALGDQELLLEKANFIYKAIL